MNGKKSAYIIKALQIFKQEGLRLSLEDLAEKMAISKKTLYNHFCSKEELHSACMQHMFTDLNQKMTVLVDDSKNAIECMREGFKELKSVFFRLSPLFINDLRKLYPDMVYSTHANDLDFFYTKIISNLEKGIREGIYDPGMNIHFISQYFSYSVFGFFFHSLLSNRELMVTNYFETVLEYHLKGIVSEKGRKLLKKSLLSD